MKNVICQSSKKKRYSTEKEAHKIILLLGINMHIYQCEDCNGYHLTKIKNKF
jgi:hypothetical protein